MTETEARLDEKLKAHKKALEKAIGSARKQLSDKSNLKTLKQYRNMLDLYLSLPKYGEAEQLRMLKMWKSKHKHAGLAIDEGVKQELTDKVKGGDLWELMGSENPFKPWGGGAGPSRSRKEKKGKKGKKDKKGKKEKSGEYGGADMPSRQSLEREQEEVDSIQEQIDSLELQRAKIMNQLWYETNPSIRQVLVNNLERIQTQLESLIQIPNPFAVLENRLRTRQDPNNNDEDDGKQEGSGTRGIPPEVLKFMRERQRLQQQQQQQGMGLAKKIYKGLYGISPAKQNYDWIDLVSHLVSKALTKERRGGCMSCSSKQGGKLDLTQEVQTTQPLPYKKSGPKKGSTNPWIEFLKEFKAKHPNMSHRDAMKAASPLYQAQKQG